MIGLKKFFKKKEKPYVYPPNVHFYKDGKVIFKTYIDRKNIEETIKEIKKKYNPDGYMTFAPTGRSTFISLEKKKKKPWGSHH